jgi:hypothetical protein
MALAACLALCGCHDLLPHRLQRLNRGPDLSGDGYNFSVPDPIGDRAGEMPMPPEGSDEGNAERADRSGS